MEHRRIKGRWRLPEIKWNRDHKRRWRYWKSHKIRRKREERKRLNKK